MELHEYFDDSCTHENVEEYVFYPNFQLTPDYDGPCIPIHSGNQSLTRAYCDMAGDMPYYRNIFYPDNGNCQYTSRTVGTDYVADGTCIPIFGGRSVRVTCRRAGQQYCTDHCPFTDDGTCDDGGPGAETSAYCAYGSDCARARQLARAPLASLERPRGASDYYAHATRTADLTAPRFLCSGRHRLWHTRNGSDAAPAAVVAAAVAARP